MVCLCEGGIDRKSDTVNHHKNVVTVLHMVLCTSCITIKVYLKTAEWYDCYFIKTKMDFAHCNIYYSYISTLKLVMLNLKLCTNTTRFFKNMFFPFSYKWVIFENLFYCKMILSRVIKIHRPICYRWCLDWILLVCLHWGAHYPLVHIPCKHMVMCSSCNQGQFVELLLKAEICI